MALIDTARRLTAGGADVVPGTGFVVACEAPGYFNLVLAGGSEMLVYATQGTGVFDGFSVKNLRSTGTTGAGTVYVTG